MAHDRSQDAAWDGWAQYYDMADGDRAPFIAFYGSLIADTTLSILDLACGTGRVTSAMAERLARQRGSLRGTRIVGSDESTEMLRMAHARDERIAWLPGDMREPPVQGPFDLITCCYNSLQFMLTDSDLLQVLNAVRCRLGEEGVFAFDIYQPNLQYLNNPYTNRMARSLVDDEGRRLEIREGIDYDSHTRVLSIDWRLVEQGKEAPPLATARYQFRQYLATDIDRFLAEAGLAVRERYGDFDRSAFTAQAKKQVLLCSRA